MGIDFLVNHCYNIKKRIDMRYDNWENKMLTTTYKHEQLTDLLRQEIEARSFDNNRFHTVKYLMEHYQVSQATLTRALTPLFEEGLLYSVSGKGTFVQSERGKRGKAGDIAGLRTLYCIVSHTEMFSRQYNMTDWFVPQGILSGLTSEGERLGFQHVNVCPVRPNIDIFRRLAQQPDSAYIFLEYQIYEAMVEHCIRNRIPYSVFAQHQKLTRQINQVWLDVEDGQRQIVEYLVSRGHRRIMFFGDKENSSRHRGYKSALRQAGIPYNKDLCCFLLSGRMGESEELMYEMIPRLPGATAVACSSDMRALGALRAALRLGKKIPEFAVTGMDNVWRYLDSPMPLTTLELPFSKIGDELAKLAHGIHGGGKCVTVKPYIIKGESA